MRLLILILTGVIVMTLIAGYLAMVDIFDPIGFKGIFAVTMGLLFFTAGLLWVTYLDHEKLVKSVLVNTREHALTGLKNRTEFFRKMANQLDSARVERRSYGLILLGIDGFRDINNRMEHSGGDTVLKHVGERIRSAIRVEDLAGHYYGDVFVIGISNMNSAGMYEMAKKIHKTVTTEPFKTKGVSLSIKASLSIVLAPPEEYDPELLLYKLADRLKKAKAMGGNRIVDSG